MKRISLVMAVGALLLVLSASVALALNTVRCGSERQEPDTPLCVGTNEADEIKGTNNEDDIFAQDGNDDVVGKEDDDIMRGEDGNDELYGEEDDDQIAGGEDNDYMSGSGGIDVIVDRQSTNDDDMVFGGGGDDKIDVLDGDGVDEVSCGKGRDRVWADRGDDIKGNCEREFNDPDDPDRPEFDGNSPSATVSAAGLQYEETTSE